MENIPKDWIGIAGILAVVASGLVMFMRELLKYKREERKDNLEGRKWEVSVDARLDDHGRQIKDLKEWQAYTRGRQDAEKD